MKNSAILVSILAIVLAIGLGLSGCTADSPATITQTQIQTVTLPAITITQSPITVTTTEPLQVSLPTIGQEQAFTIEVSKISTKHVDQSIYSYKNQSPYVYFFPIYIADGRSLHFIWSSAELIEFFWRLPNGVLFGEAEGERRTDFNCPETYNGNINIYIGQTYDSMTDGLVTYPGGVYGAGYYEFFFFSNNPTVLNVRYVID